MTDHWLSKSQGVPFLNGASEVIPPFACMVIDSASTENQELVLTCRKMTAMDASVGLFVFNGETSIPNDPTAGGLAMLDPVVTATGSGIAINEACGPVAGSWDLSTAGSGFAKLGDVADSATNGIIVRQTGGGSTGASLRHVRLLEDYPANGPASAIWVARTDLTTSRGTLDVYATRNTDNEELLIGARAGYVFQVTSIDGEWVQVAPPCLNSDDGPVAASATSDSVSSGASVNQVMTVPGAVDGAVSLVYKDGIAQGTTLPTGLSESTNADGDEVTISGTVTQTGEFLILVEFTSAQSEFAPQFDVEFTGDLVTITRNFSLTVS